MSLEVWSDIVSQGYRPDVLYQAWRSYIDRHLEDRSDASRATPLGHWLNGTAIDGTPIDYGDLSWQSLYDRALTRSERAAERQRIRSGAVPQSPIIWRDSHDRPGWSVEVAGVSMPYDIDYQTDDHGVAESLFEGWWEAKGRQVWLTTVGSLAQG